MKVNMAVSEPVLSIGLRGVEQFIQIDSENAEPLRGQSVHKPGYGQFRSGEPVVSRLAAKCFSPQAAPIR